MNAQAHFKGVCHQLDFLQAYESGGTNSSRRSGNKVSPNEAGTMRIEIGNEKERGCDFSGVRSTGTKEEKAEGVEKV